VRPLTIEAVGRSRSGAWGISSPWLLMMYVWQG
jgi:hypothetical protein